MLKQWKLCMDPEEEPGDGGSPGPGEDDGKGGNDPTGC